LSSSGEPIQWHQRLDEVPDGATLLVANEFFDALSIQQFVRTGIGWHERQVGLDGAGKLAFGLAPCPLPAAMVPAWAKDAKPGEVIEMSPARDQAAREIGARLAGMGGAALIIDYGHLRSSPGDTLQAVKAHAFQGVLECPGDADITSHVDFEALALALRLGGAAVHGPLTQGEFLSAMGLAERAEVLRRRADPKVGSDIDTAADRLAAPSQMGHLFKVTAATHPDLPSPYPFPNPMR
jgi:SAM-dependent MidA family methyltransferase